MRFARAALLASTHLLLSAGRCGGDCPAPVAEPPPMTENRARELNPSITTGVALSVTLVTGDCRAPEAPVESDLACGSAATLCRRERAALLVLLVPINTSVPASAECDGAPAVDALRRLGAIEATASSAGELVVAAPAGRFTLYVSSDGRCAVCGLAEEVGTCLVAVPDGGLAVRDVVLDRSAR